MRAFLLAQSGIVTDSSTLIKDIRLIPSISAGALAHLPACQLRAGRCLDCRHRVVRHQPTGLANALR